MLNTQQVLENSFVNHVAHAYLSKAKSPNLERVKAWRYRSFLPLLHRLHGSLTGFASHRRSIDGSMMVWLEGGNLKGSTVVLLHGFSSCKENWLPLLPFLMKKHRLLVPDLPGWGQSHFCSEKVYGFDQQVERLADWAESVLKGPAHWVGSSMGGGIAALFAARHSEWVNSLTLMNAAGVVGSELTPFERSLQEGRNMLIAHDIRGVVDLLGSTMASRSLPWLMTPFAYWDVVSRRHVNQHIFRQLLEYAPTPDQPSFSAISAPTLIVWGEQDEIIHSTCANTFKALIPHAEIKNLPGVGHMPMVENPVQAAKLLKHFWRTAQ